VHVLHTLTGSEAAEAKLQAVRIARIGVFELDVEHGELRRSGHLVALTGQPMRVLVKLVERAGEVVTREELQREVWGDEAVVDFEAGLSTCINHVRTALGDKASSPRFIETLPRRGLRFIAPIEWRVTGQASTGVSAAAGLNRWIAALAILVVVAAGFYWRGNRSQPPVIAVVSMDVDPFTPELRPVSRVLTDSLIGALSNETGARARIANPFAVREFEKRVTTSDMLKLGIDYVVMVTLQSTAGSVLVHVKLVDTSDSVMWVSDRILPLDQLQREQMATAGALSKGLAREILGSGVNSASK
jgi:DNA-binding winged helix-turn-helix (wHTH) protein/TolB-like protein